MLIDWFTVTAQIFNFLVLVWLLKRFLYKPILDAIDKREKLIASQIQDADNQKIEAQKERDDFQKKNYEFDRQREALLNKAIEEVKTERQKLLDESRKEYEDLCVKRQETLKSEQQSLSREITRRTQEEVFSITRKVLKDLSSTTLEEHMVDVFIRRLEDLKDEEKIALTCALKECSHPAFVRSAFKLSKTQQSVIEKAIKKILEVEIQFQFEVVPEKVSGIELTTNGHKVTWSIDSYLTSLENKVSEVLTERNL